MSESNEIVNNDRRKKLDGIILHSISSGSNEMPLLELFTDDEDPTVRFYSEKAVRLIKARNGQFIQKETLPINPADFGHSDDRIKMDAIKKVVNGKHQNYLLALIDLASNEKDEFNKGAAIVAIGSVSNGEETEFIAGFLKDPSPNVRLSALTALSIDNSPGLATYAAPMTEDANKDISVLAEKILRNSNEIQKQEAIQYLLELPEDHSPLIHKIATSMHFPKEYLIQLLQEEKLATDYAEKIAIYMLSQYETAPDFTRQIRNVIEARKPSDKTGQENAYSAPATTILEGYESSGNLNEEEKILSSFSPDDPDIKKGRDYLLKRLADAGIMKLKPSETEEDDSLLKLTEQYRSMARKLDDKNDEIVRTENKQVETKGGFFQQAIGSLGKFGGVAKLKLELSQMQLDMDSIKSRLGERIHNLCLIGKISDEDLNTISGKCQYATIKIKQQREEEANRRKEKEAAAVETGRAYFEKAGDMLNSFTSKAVSFTKTQSISTQIDGEKFGKQNTLRDLGNLAYLEAKKDCPAYIIDMEKIDRIDSLKSKIHLLEIESKGSKSSITGKIQAEGKSFLDMASSIVDDLKNRSETAKSLFDLEKETGERKRELDQLIISLGEDMVNSPSASSDGIAAIEQLKTKIRNQNLRIREMEVELKKVMEEVSKDDLAVMLQKRKDLEEDVNEINREILEKYGQQLAIIFTDMKGFTEKSSQKGLVKTMEMLEEHDKILIPIIKRYNGRIIKQIGDAVMASFKQPADAVLASMEIQKVLKKYNETAVEDKKIHVRIGVNCGMVIVKESDLFGDAVNIASRVEGLADGEEIFITESVYDYLDKEAVAVEKLEPRQVKGIKDAIRIFKVLY